MKIAFLHGILVGFFVASLTRCSMFKDFDSELLEHLLKCHAEQRFLVANYTKEVTEIKKTIRDALPIKLYQMGNLEKSRIR